MRGTSILVLAVALGVLAYVRLGGAGDNSETKTLTPHVPSTSRPVGQLGLPIGTYVRIEGRRQERKQGLLKVQGQTLLVDTIQQRRIDPPVALVMRNVDVDSLSSETRCVFNGYESGAWGGSPEGLPPGTPVEQTNFHFARYFVVISVEAPQGLKVKPLKDSK